MPTSNERKILSSNEALKELIKYGSVDLGIITHIKLHSLWNDDGKCRPQRNFRLQMTKIESYKTQFKRAPVNNADQGINIKSRGL